MATSSSIVKPKFVQCEIGDIRLLLDFMHREGWTDRSVAELDYVLTQSRRTCFKMMVDGTLVGLALSVVTSTQRCYLAGLLVESGRRGALDIMDGVIKFEQFLEKVSKVRSAYADQRVLPFYVEYGYKIMEAYSRYAILPHSLGARGWDVRPLEDRDLPEVLKLNDQTYGDSREPLVRHFRAVPSARAVIAMSPGGAFGGWALSRRTALGTLIGPCLAQEPEAAAALVASLRAEAVADRPVLLCGAAGKTDSWLRRMSIPFERQRVLATKVYKGTLAMERTENIYALFSLAMT